MTPVRFNPVSSATIQPAENGEFVRFADWQDTNEQLTAALTTIENARFFSRCPEGIDLKEHVGNLRLAADEQVSNGICTVLYRGAIPDGIDTSTLFGAIVRVIKERLSQIEKGFSQEGDDDYLDHELSAAAAAYLLCAAGHQQLAATVWPFSAEDFKPSPNAHRNLVRGAALAVAEMESMDRGVIEIVLSGDKDNVQ
ncbi:hypothetical protein GTGU_04105 [Trabulsiella guamensis ATCC 49490]|uniref:Phage protein n=1 Tax=Trabulsiella guamensis ATCC 49490 TaxID=1005994 RepID=A0A084ZQC2_9ENTR|nr:hypothetical protein [Trabulsiella guamensis]KFB99666.1 hypothetical protein GTGU_04105 [Trabulsiella guamensis ATCC 49490]